ncbi:MAG: hypothetical protein RLZZ196_1033 [Bacteroidota bacterium]|jgi:hypothetical protein
MVMKVYNTILNIRVALLLMGVPTVIAIGCAFCTLLAVIAEVL